MPRILVVILLVIYCFFVVFVFAGSKQISHNLGFLIVFLIISSYFVLVKKRKVLFSAFFITYGFSEFLGLVANNTFANIENHFLQVWFSYTANSFYVLAYIILLIEIVKKLDTVKVFKMFKIHLSVLIILNIWLIYVLQIIVLDESVISPEYFFELFYNSVMLVLLTASLLVYFCRDNKKYLLLFIGVLCVVFSEMFDIAYIYIVKRNLLHFMSTTLTLGAFYLFFIQSQLEDTKEEEITII